jgi:hypothetical protein
MKSKRSPAEESKANEANCCLLKTFREFEQAYQGTHSAHVSFDLHTIGWSIFLCLSKSQFKGRTLIQWGDDPVPPYHKAIAATALARLSGADICRLLPVPSKRLRMFQRSPELFERLTSLRDELCGVWETLQETIDFASIKDSDCDELARPFFEDMVTSVALTNTIRKKAKNKQAVKKQKITNSH